MHVHDDLADEVGDRNGGEGGDAPAAKCHGEDVAVDLGQVVEGLERAEVLLALLAALALLRVVLLEERGAGVLNGGQPLPPPLAEHARGHPNLAPSADDGREEAAVFLVSSTSKSIAEPAIVAIFYV